MKQTLTRTVYWTQFETKKNHHPNGNPIVRFFNHWHQTIQYSIWFLLKLPNASEKNEFNFVERLFSVIRKFYRIFCHEASVPQCTVHFSQTHRIRAETAAIFLMLCSAWRVFEDWVLSIEITKFYRAIFLWAEHSVRVVILSVSYTAALFLSADAFQLGMSVIIGITIFGDVFCAVCESRTQSATCFIAK